MKKVEFAIRVSSLLMLALLLCVPQTQAQLTEADENVRPPWHSIFRPDPIDDDDSDDDGDNEGFGFGKKIAGTWIGMGSFDLDFDCDGVADAFPGIPALDLHTIGVGGSHMVTNPNNPNTIHATWVKTGHRQLTSEGIGFGSDPNCTDPEDDGICNAFGPMVSIFSIKTVLDFDEDYQNASTYFAATVHPPTEDPLDPDAAITICTVGSHHSFRKVNVP
jgi:hypothetical protein